jgi:hypothetical protein
MRPPQLLTRGSFILVTVALLGSVAPHWSGQPSFTNVVAESGVDYEQVRGPYHLYAMPANLVGGCMLQDYDGDGLLDLYLLQGNELDFARQDPSITNRLYRNVRDWRFDDVSDQAGAAGFGYALGGAAADVDNDGFVDIYVCNYGPNVLYKNNGDGTFYPVQDRELAGSEMSSIAAFGDLNSDGLLDLYVVNYVEWSLAKNKKCYENGVQYHCPPNHFASERDRLYENLDAMRFQDQTKDSGVGIDGGMGLGIVIADLDLDGRPDVFVANDTNPNFLFRNLGDMKFVDEGLLSGAALDGAGATMSNMGVACGDYDNNGFLDLFVTHFTHELDTLYANSGRMSFEDKTVVAGLAPKRLGRTGWGTHFMDFDRDGWLDLMVTYGHIDREPRDRGTYRQRAALFRNLRNGRFAEVSPEAGDYFQKDWVGRGLAAGDIDNDGDTDVVINHQEGAPALLRNDTANAGHWLQLDLVGTRSNRSALNTKITVRYGKQERVFEVFGGGSFAASSDLRPLIGLGESQNVDELVVRWPSGAVQTFRSLPGDASYRLTEGSDIMRVP